MMKSNIFQAQNACQRGIQSFIKYNEDMDG